ncbi:MAG: dihydrodipicolinate synthase family protein [Alphaproteobacteria bacterium]|jgi:4-hydroxy-tetrahydrodipicolinate synthase|nr:dihydrodipicolinate synthase family protein [Alphaproteobacteria bacterium]MBT4018273.1 dihydrodipicolinate synthase family protein [Alphaproteobacteria bacterium]MBT5161285.1 dihydrodipicolinate synthase family protein [Alphaproteobacteria bacterium]MBT5917783.1 dihydrodipicolinate synthase family protein [Alphaproteobacteria bacterium]MBT7745024.1 dihydrodipicolinate synthase family protein [Alphaproteobacteria bacterium]
MSRRQKFEARGVIPATLAIFDRDHAINFAQTRKHLRDVADTKGLSAITVNGHASEVHACSFDEQRAILAKSLEEVGDELPLVNGIYADGSQAAADLAKMAEEEGASALLVFPPNSMTMGGQLRPEMALAHFKKIADATDLPIILFQYPAGSGLGYPLDTLLLILDQVPSVVAIKDWCNDPMLHERHIRTLAALPRPVNVLTTHSSWLMASLTMKPAGLLSGAGSVIPDLQVALFNAVQAGNLALAQDINDRIYPLSQAFYRPPFLDMHNRMKECLVLLGRVEEAIIRPPLLKLAQSEIDDLARALTQAGMLAQDQKIRAAE